MIQDYRTERLYKSPSFPLILTFFLLYHTQALPNPQNNPQKTAVSIKHSNLKQINQAEQQSTMSQNPYTGAWERAPGGWFNPQMYNGQWGRNQLAGRTRLPNGQPFVRPKTIYERYNPIAGPDGSYNSLKRSYPW
jgi:hypothetical protein